MSTISSSPLMITRAHRIAREQLDFKHLRPAQEAAIRSLIEGQDTLAIMPTGSGKSAIYQITGRLLDAPTVVISPLVALQQDQVESIEEAGIGEPRGSIPPSPPANAKPRSKRWKRARSTSSFSRPSNSPTKKPCGT